MTYLLVVALLGPWREVSRTPMPNAEACMAEIARRWQPDRRGNVAMICAPVGAVGRDAGERRGK